MNILLYAHKDGHCNVVVHDHRRLFGRYQTLMVVNGQIHRRYTSHYNLCVHKWSGWFDDERPATMWEISKLTFVLMTGTSPEKIIQQAIDDPKVPVHTAGGAW